MRQNAIRLIILLLLTALTGCETVKGVTRDVANTARNISDIINTGRTIESVTK